MLIKSPKFFKFIGKTDLLSISLTLRFFFSEVLKALLKTRDLFESWKMGDEGRDLRSAEEQEWSTTELRNSLRSIEWDLEVRIVFERVY